MSDLLTFQSPATFNTGQTGVVDFENAVIKGVSLIEGDRIAEGHDLKVDDETLKQILELSQAKGKVPVNLDHGSGIEKMNGYVTNFRMDGNKVRGDWFLLRNHSETGVMLERADTTPECFGLSVAFKGKGVPVPGGGKAARAEKVLSFDCVTRPAANDGLFSAKDVGVVDMGKKRESQELNFNNKIMDINNQNNEPTLQDVITALNHMNERLDAQDQFNEQISESLQGDQEQGITEEDIIAEAEQLQELDDLTDEQLAELGTSREEVEIAQAQFAEAYGHLFEGGDEGEGYEDNDGEEGYQDSYQGVEAGAEMAGAGMNGSAATAAGTSGEFSALRRQVIELSNEIKNEKARKLRESENIEFAEVNSKIELLASQRDQAIELAERVVAENEALRLSVNTGTRPVAASVNGTRLFNVPAETGELHEFQQQVADYIIENNSSEGEAIRFCQKQNPALHADWLKSQKPKG